MQKPYIYISVFFVLVLLYVIADFEKTYFSILPQFNTFAIVLNVHDIAFTLWILLLISQRLLIKYKQLPLHGLLGEFTCF